MESHENLGVEEVDSHKVLGLLAFDIACCASPGVMQQAVVIDKMISNLL